MSMHNDDSYKKNRAISFSEHVYIRDNWENTTDKKMASILNKKVTSIKHYRYIMGWTKPRGFSDGRAVESKRDTEKVAADAPSALMTRFLKSRFI